MNVNARFSEWLDGLDCAERAEALRADGALPPWMVMSLEAAGFAVVRADLTDPARDPARDPDQDQDQQATFLMPTYLRDLIEMHRDRPSVQRMSCDRPSGQRTSSDRSSWGRVISS